MTTPSELEALRPFSLAWYSTIFRLLRAHSLTRLSRLIITSAVVLLIYVSVNRLPISLESFTIAYRPSLNSEGDIPTSSLHPFTDNEDEDEYDQSLSSFTRFFYPPSSPSIYNLFLPLPASQADTNVRKIFAHDTISDACLEEWIGNGRWEGACLRLKVEEPAVDLVWTWVNGSDRLHIAARKEIPNISQVKTSNKNWDDRQYREHDELRFSIRSANIATESWKRSSFHLVTNSYQLPIANMTEEQRKSVLDGQSDTPRLGQIPQWLNLAKVGKTRPALMIYHDIDLFHPLPESPTDEISPAELASWRNSTIPTFNSMAVESQLANLPPSIVSDNTVFLMDDNFFLHPLTTSSFHSPIHGPVFHFQGDLMVLPHQHGFLPPDGEWRGLQFAANTLSQRFGYQGRPYLIHNARSIPLPLLHEASLAFPTTFSRTAMSRFRGQDTSGFESHTLWLATHYIALLWSWIVGKWGGPSGAITLEDKNNMWLELGLEGEVNDKVVNWPKRESRLKVKNDIEKAGLPPTGATDYSFVSADGYPFTYLPMSKYGPRRPRDINGWPDLVDPFTGRLPERPKACTLERADFFGDESKLSESATEMLKRVMVDRPMCGNCIISALLSSTGTTGFSIFLPPFSSTTTTATTSSGSPQPEVSPSPLHLPLTLPSLLAFPYPSNPRLFALRLIQRYSYVLGSTPSRFFGVTGASSAKAHLVKTDFDKESVLLCINDEMLSSNPRSVIELDNVLKSWMRERWPMRVMIEKKS